ncbi:MAG TPA: sigma-54 dependent transcriptional regulator [Gemmatimonadales bacterium]|jgi:DNA-binding NtrC family response regulator|nr:sigma-54 dependent transcriptional regulator [Gemmatimonadales bacterium]
MVGSSVTESDRQNAAGRDASSARDPLSIPADVKASIRILLVDDERTLRESCASVLQMDGFSVALAGRGEEARDLLRNRKFDIVLVDLYMSQVSGLELLRAGLEANRDLIVVVMTGNPSVTTSIEALRAGAWDYLPKPFSATHLQVLIGRASHAVMVNREAAELRQQIIQQHSHSENLSLIGISPVFRKAVELARKVAPTDASVFISGESGTGKEVIAQFIHQHSRRAAKPMVAINCAALPEPLLESEMFGHRKGAFTGADRDKPGLLEMANGGTLFLDELTEMPMAIQAKLLRVIQDGVVRRVGSESTDAQVDVRFISATNRDPQQAVEGGLLRSDLFYRLRVVPITLPPLRKRQEDISMLANHFLTHYWHRHRQMPDRCPRLSEESIAFLKSRAWRGNVRELQNVIEHTAVLVDPEQLIQPSEIPLYEEASGAPVTEAATTVYSSTASEPYHVAKDRVVVQFEKEYLAALVARAAGNMSKAARLAGVDRTTLYRLIDKHQLMRVDGEDVGA